MALIKREQVVERLKAGEKLHGEGNTMFFKNHDFITASTDIYLRDNGLVKVSGTVSCPIYTWANKVQEGMMKGLYQKYIITKANGKPLAEGWQGIVLRIDDGQYVDACREGALAFAKAVRHLNPELCQDIHLLIRGYQLKEAEGK